jgi:hypothetical protein
VAYAITATSGFHCGYCIKPGHTEDRCFKTKKEVANPEIIVEIALCVYESALIARAIEEVVLKETKFIADTGASSHMQYSNKYLRDMVPHTASITANSIPIGMYRKR